ncbi:unnamed protein product [Medioppia subpectinata]|uniref:Uncharacterized protein n=1 Tax=Medioppia subpectinata TaxID=1979941 RepID=A0A7R9PW91_9ACAR|nr:unnamed protein product [Medioppia subpectinata]CAG2102650.1 unnamed protein product [Medioppia subpectinata]
MKIVGIVSLVFVALKLTISVLKGFWTTFLGYKLGFGIEWKAGDNVWAVVTGATDGIGLQYAKQMAQKAYNLVIISRNEDKLMATQKSLLNDYKDCKQDLYGSQMNETYFNVNMFSYLKLIEIVLPKMVDRKRGIVINISSQTAITPVPLMTTYAATKAFIRFLSDGLSVEYEGKGVTIQTVMPSMTKTKLLHESNESSVWTVGADEFVSAAIQTVGIESTTYGHWKHKLLSYAVHCVIGLIGQRLVAQMAHKVMKQSRDHFYLMNSSKNK